MLNVKGRDEPKENYQQKSAAPVNFTWPHSEFQPVAELPSPQQHSPHSQPRFSQKQAAVLCSEAL